MSKYTTEVRFICESVAGYDMSQGYGRVEDIIDKSWESIFDFDFPIYDEAYRSVLCKKILRHYYTREIGFETVGLWKLKLSTKMQEIMPYYNKLYETELIKFNPMYDADYTKEGNSEDKGENQRRDIGSRNATGSSARNRGTDTQENGTSWNVYSDTPQGALTNVANETYLTDARKITDNRTGRETTAEDISTRNNENNTNTANGNFDNTREYVDHVFGKFPGKSNTEMLVEFRNSLLNIDLQVINELNKLFMLVW